MAKERYMELDIIRTLAILLIFVLHFHFYFPVGALGDAAIFVQNNVAKAGYFFFFISGMMLTAVYFKRFSQDPWKVTKRILGKALLFLAIFTVYIVGMRYLDGNWIALDSWQGISDFYLEHNYFNTILLQFALIYAFLPLLLALMSVKKVGKWMPLALLVGGGSWVSGVEVTSYYPIVYVLFVTVAGAVFYQLRAWMKGKVKSAYLNENTLLLFWLIVFFSALELQDNLEVGSFGAMLVDTLFVILIVEVFTYGKRFVTWLPLVLGKESLVSYTLMNLLILLGYIYFPSHVAAHPYLALFITLLVITLASDLSHLRKVKKKV